VLPLIVILLMVYFGCKVSTIKRWKQQNRTLMRIGVGVLLVFLGWLLILIANGSISFQ